MGVFYFTLGSTFISAYVSRISKDKKILSIMYAAIVGLILIIVAAFRSNIGDTELYMHSYTGLNNYKFSFDGDWGFSLFQYWLYTISTDPQLLIIVTSIITNLLNVLGFYFYKSYFELQIYMFITSGYYIVTMNGIRQSMAAAFLFVFCKLIEKEKLMQYSIVVLIASTFHQSALIMIPLYFIVRSKAWSKTTLSIIIVSCIGFIFFSQLFPVLLEILQDTNYGYYAEHTADMQGSSFMRVIVNMVPVVLAYLKRKELNEKWSNSNIFINFAIINVIFTAFGMYNWIFNRFTIYFQLYNFVLIPYIIKNCFQGKEKRLMYLLLLICYFFFFYYEQVIGLKTYYATKYLKFEELFYYKQ